MVGKRPPRQRELCLTVPVVPATTRQQLLSRIDALVDWEPVRELVAPCFAVIGRPSIDPVVMAKLMLLGYLFGIASDRALLEECTDRLSFREFLGYNVGEALPDHSTVTVWRQRLGAAVFRELLWIIVRQCAAHGMVVSEARTIDATSVKAQASKYGPTVPVPEGEEIEAHLDRVFADEVPELEEKTKTIPVSLNDPEARLQAKGQEAADFRYQASFCADAESGLITDAVATPTEHPSTAVEHVRADPLPVTEVVADRRYDDGDTLAALQAAGVTPYVPKTKRDKPGQLSKERFTYDPATDSYQCPNGKPLPYAGFNRHSRLHQYVARQSDCAGCPLKAQCTPGQRRMITRTEHETAREQTVRDGPRYRELMRRRGINEHLNFLGKRDHALRRARALGLDAMGIQVALVAIAINLKKLVKWHRANLLGVLCRAFAWLAAILGAVAATCGGLRPRRSDARPYRPDPIRAYPARA